MTLAADTAGINPAARWAKRSWPTAILRGSGEDGAKGAEGSSLGAMMTTLHFELAGGALRVEDFELAEEELSEFAVAEVVGMDAFVLEPCEQLLGVGFGFAPMRVVVDQNG